METGRDLTAPRARSTEAESQGAMTQTTIDHIVGTMLLTKLQQEQHQGRRRQV